MGRGTAQFDRAARRAGQNTDGAVLSRHKKAPDDAGAFELLN